MNIVKAQKVPRSETKPDSRLIEFCYYFQQYKYSEAKRLPYKRVIEMLTIARKERAKVYFELVQIASAPHTKKGEGIKKLMDHYKKLAD